MGLGLIHSEDYGDAGLADVASGQVGVVLVLGDVVMELPHQGSKVPTHYINNGEYLVLRGWRSTTPRQSPRGQRLYAG